MQFRQFGESANPSVIDNDLRHSAGMVGGFQHFGQGFSGLINSIFFKINAPFTEALFGFVTNRANERLLQQTRMLI